MKRYKVGERISEENKKFYFLDNELVLQELIKVEKADLKVVEEWKDIEVFDDLESKEQAIEKLQKMGYFTLLKR